MKGFKMPKTCTTCHCCPYGFHIDRDFVRYCESLYNIAQLDKLKLKKRERRKEQITVESCLGLKSIKPRKNVGADSISTGDSVLCDLDGVMSDFEDAWQKSVTKSSLDYPISDVSDSHKLLATSSIHASKISSDVSLEQNPVSLISIPFDNIRQFEEKSFIPLSIPEKNHRQPLFDNHDIEENYGISNELTTNMESFHAGGSSYGMVGIHRDALSNIREQMATSLKRMKELEDQVKCIPVLQVKISTLNEEKNLLLDKLKVKQFNLIHIDEKYAKEQTEKCYDKSIIPKVMARDLSSGSLTSSTEDLTSPAMAHNLNDVLAKRCYVDSEIISQIKFEENSLCSKTSSLETAVRDVKHVGTLCSVLTRDIGVGHIQNKCKSTGVGDEGIQNVFQCLHCLQEKGIKPSASMSSESLESDSDSVYNDQIAYSHQKLMNRFPRKSVKSVSTSPIKDMFSGYKSFSHAFTDARLEYRQTGISTELHMSDIITFSELEMKNKMKKNKSTSCDYTLKSTKSVQVPIKFFTCDKTPVANMGVQTCSSMPIFDMGRTVKKCSIGIGDCNVNDIFCYKCAFKRYKNVSVGECSVTDVICDNCHGKRMVSTGCGHQSIFDVSCQRCELKQTETVGVGDGDINQPVSMFITSENDKFRKLKDKPVMMRSVGINTLSDKYSSTNNGIQICDKCTAAIHSVAEDFTARKNETKSLTNKKPDLSSSSSPSKTSWRNSKPALQKLKISSKVPNDGMDNSTNKSVGKVSEIPRVTGSQGIKESGFSSNKETTDGEASIDESPETVYPFKVSQCQSVELSKEVKAACKVLCDCLQKPNTGLEKKMLSSLKIIKNEWFQIANQRNPDPHIIEGHLDAFEEISGTLLQKIVNLSDENGNTALHYAVSYSNFDVVSILVDSKVCDVNKQNKAGYTCIMLVALADTKNDAHSYVVQRLFSMGDINIKATQNGQTALMLAVSHGKLEIVKMLLEAGAEVNLQDNDGSTALMCAAEHGHIEIVRNLLSHPDCDPTIIDSDGCNALTIAMEAGHKDIGLLIYANMNFSRGNSPYSSLKQKRKSNSRSTPPPRTPTLRTPSRVEYD